VTHPSKEIVGTVSDVLGSRKIALCVTGSVAAFLSPAIARELMRQGAEVYVFMTPSAATLVSPTLMQWASGNPVVAELTAELEHVRYAAECDLVLVAPATANTIAKMAAGVADNPVTTLALTAMGYRKKVVVVPAMHEPMWAAEQTQRNIETLKKLGVTVIEPAIAEQKAKLADISCIVDNVVRLLHPKRLPEGVRVLVTAGATVEYIDPIRVVSNQSSGRMGLEIAMEAFRRGAEVGLILGHASVNPSSYIPVVRVDDSESLKQALKAQLAEKPPNIYFSTIAVADYRPIRRREAKADTSTENRLHIDLESVGKVLPTVKELSPSTVVVAFKAEYRVDEKQLVEKAKRLLDYSDIVYASDVARPEARFGSATTSGVVVDRKGNIITVSNKRKSEVAALLLDLAASMLSMG
jgi:phosphopantothenoylcysteine decarboxylase/phosphopantothenate--cysteine ligase